MTGKVTLTGSNIVFLISAVLIIIFQSVFVVAAGYSNNSIYAMLVVSEFLCILAPALIYAVIKKANIRETFRLNKPGLAPAALILVISVPAYFVAMMLNNIVAYFIQFIGKIPSQPIPVPKNISELVIGILIIGVTPGICEEMLHRGLLLKAYEKRGSYKAVVIISLFFGLFHFDITNFLGPVFLGLIIGFFVIRTNSIFSGMLAHFLNNAISEVLQYFGGAAATPRYITVSSQELEQLILIGMIGVFVTAVLLVAFKRITEGVYPVIQPISSRKKDFTSIISHWPVIILLILYFFMFMFYILTVVLTGILGL
jgi:uncharacterized protein